MSNAEGLTRLDSDGSVDAHSPLQHDRVERVQKFVDLTALWTTRQHE